MGAACCTGDPWEGEQLEAPELGLLRGVCGFDFPVGSAVNCPTPRPPAALKRNSVTSQDRSWQRSSYTGLALCPRGLLGVFRACVGILCALCIHRGMRGEC